MKSWATKNGFKIYQILSGRSNSYLIEKGSFNMLVDTGKKSAYIKLKQNIESLNLTENRISILILTHTHFDHCQNTKRLKDDYDCQVIVSEKATEEIRNGYTRLPRGTSLIPQLISNLGQLIGKRRFGYTPFTADVLVNENYDFDSGNLRIKIITSAGHSADSISIIIDNEIAIVGDAMFGVFRNSVFPPYADNQKEMVKTWAKLLNTGCEVFLPGHGKEIERKLFQKEYNKYNVKLNKI